MFRKNSNRPHGKYRFWSSALTKPPVCSIGKRLCSWTHGRKTCSTGTYPGRVELALAGGEALISDAVHNFSDATALLIAYFAFRMGKKGVSAQNTFGYKRAEILGAMINVALLVAAAGFILYAAIGRFLHPQPVLGLVVASMLPGKVLTTAFGIAVLIGGIHMLTARPPKTSDEPSSSLTAFILWGIPLGVFSGIIGIGGGVLMIPIMVYFLKFKMHQAVGTSTALMTFTAAGGALSYWINGTGVSGLPPYSTGYLNWYQWAILAGVSIPWAVVGADTAHLLPAKQLKYLFVLVMLYMGLKMCGVFTWLGLPL